jgi:hypothetical protein
VIVVVLEVMPYKPFRLALRLEEQTEAVRVEEAPAEGVEEVRRKSESGRQSGDQSSQGVHDEHHEGEVCGAITSAIFFSSKQD